MKRASHDAQHTPNGKHHDRSVPEKPRKTLWIIIAVLIALLVLTAALWIALIASSSESDSSSEQRDRTQATSGALSLRGSDESASAATLTRPTPPAFPE